MDVWRGTSTNAANYLGNLTPINPTITVAPNPVDARALRQEQNATFNYIIPDSWTETDALYLRIGFNLNQRVRETSASNNNRDHILRLVRTRPLEIVGPLYTSPDNPEGSTP